MGSRRGTNRDDGLARQPIFAISIRSKRKMMTLYRLCEILLTGKP